MMLGVRWLTLAKLSSRRYEDRAIEGERWIGKGIGKLCKAESEHPLILGADRISLKELVGNPGAWDSIGPKILAWAKKLYVSAGRRDQCSTHFMSSQSSLSA